MTILDIASVDEIKEALINEYKRKLMLYSITNERLKKKYKMTFHEFEKKNIVKKMNYTWEVEKDSMEWEHSIEGLKSIKKKIKLLKQSRE
jgi:hypothetical protein